MITEDQLAIVEKLSDREKMRLKMAAIKEFNRRFTQKTVTLSDAQRIYRAMEPEMAKNGGALLDREEGQIVELAPNTLAYYEGDQLVGTVAIVPFGEWQYHIWAELCLWWVAPPYRHQNIGKIFIAEGFGKAYQNSYTSIFALTTSPEGFKKLKFNPVPRERVPAKKFINYPANRKSVVLIQSVAHYFRHNWRCAYCSWGRWKRADRGRRNRCQFCGGRGYLIERIIK